MVVVCSEVQTNTTHAVYEYINAALGAVTQPLLLWKSNEYQIFLCVHVDARARRRVRASV
jgi:hypothetical protein